MKRQFLFIMSVFFVFTTTAGHSARYRRRWRKPKPTTTTKNTPFNVLNIEIGPAASYNLDASKHSFLRYFGLNFAISDSMEFGFVNIGVEGVENMALNLFRAGLYLGSRVGLNLLIGGGRGTSGSYASYGAGFFFDIFKGSAASFLAAALQLKLEYINTATINSGGLVVIGLTARLGF